MRVVKRDKQDRHETASGVRYERTVVKGRVASIVDTRPLHAAHQHPDTEYEALMVCGPGETPKETLEEVDSALMGEALARLTEKELAVVELVVFGQMSLSQAGVWLGRQFGREAYSKQGVSNIRDAALRKLRRFYEEQTETQSWE